MVRLDGDERIGILEALEALYHMGWNAIASVCRLDARLPARNRWLVDSVVKLPYHVGLAVFNFFLRQI